MAYFQSFIHINLVYSLLRRATSREMEPDYNENCKAQALTVKWIGRVLAEHQVRRSSKTDLRSNKIEHHVKYDHES